MKLRLLSVGHKMPAWVVAACSDFSKRMPRELQVEIIDIKPEKRAAGNSTENIQQIESKRMIEAVGTDYLVACDERGSEINTLQLDDKLQAWESLGGFVSSVIGGSEGLHDSLKQQSGCLWGHAVVRCRHTIVRDLL